MKNIFFFLFMISIFFAVAMTSGAASNFIQQGDVLDLTWSTLSPESAGTPVVKGTATASGLIFGVALKATGTEGETVPVVIKGVVDIPVRAIGSAIAIGDYIYAAAPADINTSTASCTNVDTGYIIGKSLESLVTASNTQTIKVLLLNR